MSYLSSILTGIGRTIGIVRSETRADADTPSRATSPVAVALTAVGGARDSTSIPPSLARASVSRLETSSAAGAGVLAATASDPSRRLSKADALAILRPSRAPHSAPFSMAGIYGLVFSDMFRMSRANPQEILVGQIQEDVQGLIAFLQANPSLRLDNESRAAFGTPRLAAFKDECELRTGALASKVMRLAKYHNYTDPSSLAIFTAALQDLVKDSIDSVNRDAIDPHVKDAIVNRFIPNAALWAINKAFAEDLDISTALRPDSSIFKLPVVISKHFAKMRQAFSTFGDDVVTFKSLVRMPDLKGLQTRLADPAKTEVNAAVNAFKKACDGQIATHIKKAQELRGVCGSGWIAHIDAMKTLLILVTDAQRALNSQPALTDAEKKAITDLNPEAASTHADLTARLAAVDAFTSTITVSVPRLGAVKVKEIVDAVAAKDTTLKTHQDHVARYNTIVGAGSNPDVKAADGSYIVAAGSEVAKLQEQKANAVPVIEKKFADLLAYVNVVVAAVDGAQVAARTAAIDNVRTRDIPSLHAFIASFNTAIIRMIETEEFSDEFRMSGKLEKLKILGNFYRVQREYAMGLKQAINQANTLAKHVGSYSALREEDLDGLAFTSNINVLRNVYFSVMRFQASAGSSPSGSIRDRVQPENQEESSLSFAISEWERNQLNPAERRYNDAFALVDPEVRAANRLA